MKNKSSVEELGSSVVAAAKSQKVPTSVAAGVSVAPSAAGVPVVAVEAAAAWAAVVRLGHSCGAPSSALRGTRPPTSRQR